MGFGMAVVNSSVLYLAADKIGNIILNPMVIGAEPLMDLLQINFLQPIYTFTFGNGLIACLVFMGIGVLADLSYIIAYPFTSMLIAFLAELGTILLFPIAIMTGLAPGEAAAIAMVGGADGPMVLFTSLMLAKDLLVPITIIAYVYLSLTYGCYPYLVRLMVPKKFRRMEIPQDPKRTNVSSREKLVFSIVICIILCLLFPVASPLFLCFFLGVAIREAKINKYVALLENVFLYFATFFLGLLLGVLCEATTILDPRVLILLLLGMLALLISGIGGIAGGYLVYFISKRKYNPTIGIAGVSCVPTTAKVAQKEVSHTNPYSFVLMHAMGPNIGGVITTAIFTGLYVTFLLVR
jgi:oxaloacetate decarboxylase beta subunit